MNRRLVLIVSGLFIVLFAVLVGGCGQGGPVLGTNGVTTRDIRLSDGREVACVIYAGYGITCDFNNPLSHIDVPLEDTK